jgi:hypothetical protein
MAPEKGVHILLDAFRIVLAQHPELLPVCDDPHVLELEAYFRRTCEKLIGKIALY